MATPEAETLIKQYHIYILLCFMTILQYNNKLL